MQYTVIHLAPSLLGDPIEQADVDRYNAIMAEELVNAELDNLYSVSVSLDGNYADEATEARHDPALAAAMERAWERFCHDPA